MVGSKDLEPSNTPLFPNVFFHNQFCAEPQWPAPNTSLSGRTAIITGANTGLGYEAALQLLGLKLSHLILAVRSPERGEAAATKLRQLYPNASIEVWQLDMSSYDSVQAFTRRVQSQLSRIDIVLLNAGCMKLNFHKLKSTGHEECVHTGQLPLDRAACHTSPPNPQDQTNVHLEVSPRRLTIVSAALSLAAKFPNRDANPLMPSFDDPKIIPASVANNINNTI